MIFDLPTFTLIHVVLSIAGIVTGLVAVGGLVAGARLDGWIGTFLVTTILTNATAFGFPFTQLLPSHIVAGLSLVVLAVALAARYWKGLAGAWRPTFVVTSVIALYFDVFVLFVQLFQKTPALTVLAPGQQGPAFAITQLLVVALFVLLGRVAVKGFRGAK